VLRGVRDMRVMYPASNRNMGWEGEQFNASYTSRLMPHTLTLSFLRYLLCIPVTLFYFVAE